MAPCIIPPPADSIRLATIVCDLSPGRLEAWLVCGHRMVAGMLAADAEALMWRELAAMGRA